MHFNHYIVTIIFQVAAVISTMAEQPIIDLNEKTNNLRIYPNNYTVVSTNDKIIYTPTTLKKLIPLRNAINIENTNATYWVHIKINKRNTEKWFLEFLDAHINSIEAFQYRNDTLIHRWNPMGMDYPFTTKNYLFKNFIFPIEKEHTGVSDFLIRINSSTKTSFVFKLRTENNFISHAKTEYHFLGLFYGLVIITIITNFIIFFFLRERVYLYYAIYLIGCSLLFLSEDALGFEFYWPEFPLLNKWVTSYSPALLVISFYLYSNRFLKLQNYFPKASRYLIAIILICVLYFFAFAIITSSTADYRFFILPFITIYGAGIYLWTKGSRSAKYFVAAHSFVIIGIIFLIFRKAGINILNTPLTYYSLYIGFAVEMAILSYALGERIQEFKTLRFKAQEKLLHQLKSRQEAQRKLVLQLEENQHLKDQLNTALELEVQRRSKEIIEQNKIIADQNEELKYVNEKLLEQADKINKLNEKLDLDNWALKSNIKSITEARILSKAVDYQEFIKLYPDQDSCLQFLAQKKWAVVYSCRKCLNDIFCAGRTPYSRRCTKCRYEETATAFTLLHKCKIPLDKAFYAIFLIFSSRGKITSVSLSQKLKIRQSTCWMFIQKVNAAISTNKKAWEKGWDSILLDTVSIKTSETVLNDAQLLDEEN